MANRLRGYCPCCEQVVEFYTDGLSGGGHPYRCGNCFEGMDLEEVEHVQEVHAQLQDLDAQKRTLLDQARRR